MSILSGVQPVNPWLSHIGTFFNEANEKHIKGVSEECGIPMDQLAKVFYSLPVTYQESNFPKIYYGK
jgi:hypothetical protein